MGRGSVPLGVAAFGYALSQRVTTPAGATLLYSQVGPASRSNASAVRYAAINTGASIGGLAGGLMIPPGHPATFQLVFIAQGAVCAAAAGLVLLVPATEPSAEPTGRRDRPRRARPYRDRAFLQVWLLTLLLYTVGISQITRGFALYVTATLHRSPALFGVALAVTTLTIAAAQLPVLRLAAGRRRMAVAAAMFGTLAAGWLLALLADDLPHAAVAVALFSCAVVFGVTETLMSPTLPPVAAELAPAGSEGRYNAAFSLTLFGGGAIAPALAGMLLTLGPVTLPLTCSAAALLGALAAALIDRHLPASIATIPG